MISHGKEALDVTRAALKLLISGPSPAPHRMDQDAPFLLRDHLEETGLGGAGRAKVFSPPLLKLPFSS